MKFQPTLPARGATRPVPEHPPQSHFNPRSPHGERQLNTLTKRLEALISTHAPRTGSDMTVLAISSFGGAFQPTLPARGATI